MVCGRFAGDISFERARSTSPGFDLVFQVRVTKDGFPSSVRPFGLTPSPQGEGLKTGRGGG